MMPTPSLLVLAAVLLPVACAPDLDPPRVGEADADTDTDPAEPAAAVNLLANGSFELPELVSYWDPAATPESWGDFGGGSFHWHEEGQTTEPITTPAAGVRAVALFGSPYAGRFQRVAATEGHAYTLSAWSQSLTGAGAGTVKIEFHDASDVKLEDMPLELSGPMGWGWFHVSAVAPSGTTQVTATLVGAGGTPVWFDNVAIHEVVDPSSPVVSFDLSAEAASGHTVGGTGAQIWGYDWELEALGTQLEALGITHVRLENVTESASMTELQATEAVLDGLGIETVFLAWSAPAAYRSGGMLDDPEGFGQFWADEVALLDAAGIRPEWIELMNEPDSGGAWSTGISTSDYDTLVLATRAALDDAGFNDVGIVGPGTAALNWGHSARNMVLGLSQASAAAVGAWSVHTWDDGATCAGGASCMLSAWPDFAYAVAAQDPDGTRPVFVTEAATKETTFGSRTFILPDSSGTGNATWSTPSAVRTVENLLALWSAGTDVPFLWQLRDNPTEATRKNKGWGTVDLDGNAKPVFAALEAVLPNIEVGMEVVPTVQDALSIFATVFLDRAGGEEPERVVVVITRDSEGVAVPSTVQLYHCPEGLHPEDSMLFAHASEGDPDAGVADEWSISEPVLSFARSEDAVCTVSVDMPAWSVVRVVLAR